MARFDGTGSYQTTVTFRLATAITDDGEGGDASGTGAVAIPIRLVPVSGQAEAARIVENQFPGTSTYTSVFYAWVDDTQDYKFTPELRKQRRPIGECELPSGVGRLECSIGDFPIEIAANEIGEKFTALWTLA